MPKTAPARQEPRRVERQDQARRGLVALLLGEGHGDHVHRAEDRAGRHEGGHQHLQPAASAAPSRRCAARADAARGSVARWAVSQKTPTARKQAGEQRPRLREPDRGQTDGDDRPEDEADLVDHGLEGVRGVQLRGVPVERRPAGPDHRADARHAADAGARTRTASSPAHPSCAAQQQPGRRRRARPGSPAAAPGAARAGPPAGRPAGRGPRRTARGSPDSAPASP